MKKLASTIIVVGVVSLALGVISRLSMRPLPIARGGIEASVLMDFTDTCLLLAIALLLIPSAKEK